METFATARLPQTSSCRSFTFPSRRQAAGKEWEQSMFEYNEKHNEKHTKKRAGGESTERGVGISERSERKVHQVWEQFSC